MARTMSVSDDQTNITVSITVDDSGDTPRNTEVRFTAANGASVTADDLKLVGYFGLTPAQVPALPTPEPATPSPVPTVSDAARAVIVGKPETPATSARAKNFEGKRPTDAALVKLWASHNGVKSAMARAVGCHASTMGEWIKDATARGAQFPAAS